ncbi:MAG TPA: hypothetical protein VLR26_12000, partial [Frankiaceae bacterium]|nr:hypothetical protein [Frankiaceae bacterium]
QQDGTQQDGTQQDGTQKDGTQKDGTQKDETQQDGTLQDETTPGEARTPFADSGAMASGMLPVDEWGTGDREKPQETPKDELDSDV